MAAQFDLEVRGHIVVVAQRGSPTFEEANEVVAATVVAALKAGTNNLLFDVRLADLANYYSYIVRHAEMAPSLGLHTGFRIAIVGLRDQADVLSFMARVGQNRGWKTQTFFDMDKAVEWFGQETG